MKILHYFLGFPPYRSGGLTKYATDLMIQQKLDGHNVGALWPGEIKIFSKKVRIQRRKKINGIENYELINPLPVSLDEGIWETNSFTKSCDIVVYVDFFKKYNFDIIHIHTLMGLHKEFIEAAKALKIRTVFTTHDYFGICPKVTLYKNGRACEDDHHCIDCIECNAKALSLKKIWIMQSPFYRAIKDSIIVKRIRRKHRSNFFEENEENEIKYKCVKDINTKSLAFEELRKYYLGIFNLIDMIHFNSSVTETIYKRYFVPKNSKVFSITHKNIIDCRKLNHWEPIKKLRITCLAPAKPFKGFNVLRNALDELWNEGKKDFQLNIFSPVKNPSPYMIVHENGFEQEKLASIFRETDILVAPSIWYETFGFTVLEALSYGVPVIVSDNVGAKDIVGEAGIIVEAGNVEQLKQVIDSLTVERINELRNHAINDIEIKVWRILVDEIYELYRMIHY